MKSWRLMFDPALGKAVVIERMMGANPWETIVAKIGGTVAQGQAIAQRFGTDLAYQARPDAEAFGQAAMIAGHKKTGTPAPIYLLYARNALLAVGGTVAAVVAWKFGLKRLYRRLKAKVSG